MKGGNKGIGKEIARRIGTELGYRAIIACRDVDLGEAAARDLRDDLRKNDHGEYAPCDAMALPVPFDLADRASIASAADWVRDEYDGVMDVLVNNAAVCFNDPTLYGTVDHTPFVDQAGITIRTNYLGTLYAIEAFLPMLEKSCDPKIVNVASAAGRLTILRSQELVDEFTSDALTIPRLSELMETFVSDVENGTHSKKGWPSTCYGVSKLGIIALTKILAREHPQMMINSVDPGYCRTDQNDNRGTVDPYVGAYTPYLLALMESDYDDEDAEGEGGEGYSGDDDDEDEDEEVMSGLHFYEEREMPWTYQSS